MNIVVKAITRALLVSQILFVDLKLCYMYPIMHAQKSQIATRVLLGRPVGVNRKNCHISHGPITIHTSHSSAYFL